jgi:hypothetical protein
MNRKVAKFIHENIEECLDENDYVILTDLENEICVEFDVDDLDDIEEDLSFKIMKYIEKTYQQYLEP